VYHTDVSFCCRASCTDALRNLVDYYVRTYNMLSGTNELVFPLLSMLHIVKSALDL